MITTQEARKKEWFKAVEDRNMEKMKSLLEQGVDIDTQNDFGDTALIKSVFWQGGEKVTKFLIENGANLNIQNIDGETAALFASRMFNSASLRMLINNGADVTLKNKDFDTVLIEVASNLYMEKDICKEVADKSKNADLINNQDMDGYSALIYASLKNKTEMAHQLVQFGADVNKISIDNMTALTGSVTNNNTELSSYLMEHQAKVNVVDKTGDSLLHSTVYNGNIEIMKDLIQHDANINATDKMQRTPLMVASLIKESYTLKSMDVLLKNNADLSAKDMFGKTAYDYAKENDVIKNNPELLSILNSAINKKQTKKTEKNISTTNGIGM